MVFGRGKAPPSSVKVLLRGKSEAFEAQVVGSEAEKDLAVLRIVAENLPPPLELSSSSELCVGVVHARSCSMRPQAQPNGGHAHRLACATGAGQSVLAIYIYPCS